jgi:sugar O-acyltransferase (sialic acid O-acetyltransferase NeuD family)
MSVIILAAASGLAREVLEAVRADGRNEVCGIVDDDPARWGDGVEGMPVLGGLDAIHDHDGVEVVLCAGGGMVRRRMAARLGLPVERYATVVHPSVRVPPSCSVGAGSVVLAGAVLTASVRIGGHVVVMPNATLTHDDVLDDFATICAGVTLGGGVRVGAAAYVGMGAGVRENVQIGAEAVVGMGAVVLTDVPPGQTWAGVPAALIERTSAPLTKAATS